MPATEQPLAPHPTVLALAGGRSLELVWTNELGGQTYRLDDDLFLKWNPATSGPSLAPERERLQWAARFIAVPHVVEHGRTDDGEWLITEAIEAESAVSDRCKADPARTVSQLGESLRAMHDALPTESCPFTWSAEVRIGRVTEANKATFGDPADWRADSALPVSLDEALKLLETPPSVDQLVVCHGDPCAPNTLIDAGWQAVAHVDLGTLGLADRWADLAVATWSATWNYGPGWEHLLIEAYGVERDPERELFYRVLWELCP